MSRTREIEALSLTVVIEQQCEKFCPPVPFESGVGLPQEFAGMD